MSFLEKYASKHLWIEHAELRFLSTKPSYNKEITYFEALNPDCLEFLAHLHEQEYPLPVFRGEEDIVIFKVNTHNIDSTIKLNKEDKYNCKIKLRPYTYQGKKGFTPYMEELEKVEQD